MRSTTPTFSNGIRLTVPKDQKLTLSDKKRDRSSNAKYLTELKAEKHRQFLETLEDEQFPLNGSKMSYKNAIGHLHNQLHSLDLDYDRFKLKQKRNI